ncbi:GNAT family N-acetyltransferase [Deinococcus sp.]|uniref:GNAT family N-acetyltransferase n=1 Tax=Deinococcus sp. TaxID=47478 RepID=UPI0025B9EB86|nr:GNAT family N-acetyltransferase [Deinococcus sp.]
MTTGPVTVALRSLSPGDAEAAVRWAADPEFCRAVDWTPGLSARVVRRHWQLIIAAQEPAFHRWGVTVNGALVGYADLARIGPGGAELGIALGDRAWWGRGVAFRACQELLTLAWEADLPRVTALVHAPNARSHALMRRLGMHEDGQADPEPYGGEVVAVTRYAVQSPQVART